MARVERLEKAIEQRQSPADAYAALPKEQLESRLTAPKGKMLRSFTPEELRQRVVELIGSEEPTTSDGKGG